MIAVDSSTFIAHVNDQDGADVEIFHDRLVSGNVFLPPVVVSEMMSDPNITEENIIRLKGLRVLHIKRGYWFRAGETRSILLQKGLKARLPDSLIAQSCIDHDVPLLTRDRDFDKFAAHCGLKLVAL